MSILINSLKSVLATVNTSLKNFATIVSEAAATLASYNTSEIDEALAGSETSQVVIRTIVTYTDTTHTLTNDDVWKWVEMENESDNTFVLPDPANFEPTEGVSLMVRQMGAGTTTIVTENSNVTILNPHGTNKISKQYGSVGIQYRGDGVYCVDGGFAES